MTGPPMPATWTQLPGGYQPIPAGQPQQGQPPLPPGLQPPPMLWQPPGPPGAPFEGTPPIYPNPPQPQPPPVQQQPAPQAQPQPQPQFPTQPAWAPPVGTDLNARLEGPNIPNELRGRTVAEALQIYNGMRNVVLQTIPGPGTQPVVPPQAQPAPPPPSPDQTPPASTWDWRAPEAGIERVVEKVITSRVMPALQPLLLSQGLQSMRSARDTVAAEMGPAFNQVEHLVLQRLQGADPQALQNPQMWRVTAESVIGALTLQQRAQQQRAPGAQQVAPGAQPLPNLGSFFTEQPSVGVPSGGGVQLTPQQAWAAQAMGMSVADYIAWGGGNPPGGQRR